MADVFDFYVYDDRSIKFALAEPIMLEDKNVTQFRFRIPKVLNNIDMSSWEWWFIFVNAKKVKYTTQLTLTDDEDEPENYSVATYTVGYGFSGYVGQVSFSIEALNVSGEDIVNEWHTKTYTTHVLDTLQGTRAVVPEPEADAGKGLTAEEKSLILELFSKAAYAEDDASTAYDRLEALWTVITRLVSLNLSHVTSSNQSASVENGSRYVTNLTADTNYSINEVTVTMGGVDITSTSYSSGTVSIPSVTGNIVITATAVAQQDTYIQDGLVMWLDGEYNSTNGTHATSLTTWVDQTGNGWDWTNRGGATVSTKSIVFDGGDTSNFNGSAVPQNVVMMELVYKVANSGGGVILAGFGRNYIGNISIASATGKLSFHTSTGSGDSTNTAFEIGYDDTIHSVNSAGYVDGEAYTTTTSAADWQYANPSVGYYRGSTGSQIQYKYTGEIYCIRLYSRALTAEEIAHNFAIDAERFGIGA